MPTLTSPTTAPPAEASALTYRYRTSRVAVGTFFALAGAAFLLDSAGIFSFTAGWFWPLVIISIGVSLLLNRARRLLVEEDRSAQLAVAEERVRIARELHDIVAHGVSLMTIQISAARRVQGRDGNAAEESLRAAEETGRQTLSELEGMLSVLRGADASIGAAAGQRGSGAGAAAARSPLPRAADIPALLDSVRQAGRSVTYEVLGDAPPLPASIDTAVYRVVQEAVTNAVKHAGESPIDVQVIFTPTSVTIFVDDEGPVVSPSPVPGGHGLMGMRERLAALGGTLEAGPRRPGPGWRVFAKLPLLFQEP